MITVITVIFALLALVTVYFLIVTRFSIMLQELLGSDRKSEHIYWLYSNRFLIWLTDRQVVISAILLFNYNRLVRDVVGRLNPELDGKDVLQISCAFGDLTEKVVRKCVTEGARKIVILDLIASEITHTRSKLEDLSLGERCIFVREDAVNLSHTDESFDYVVIFFLFHELPLSKKVTVLKEAARVLKPGGKIVFGEFHRPRPLLLRLSGRLFFSVFEKYAEEMWGAFNPETVLDGETPFGWVMSVKTYFFGNYQVFSAEKLGPGEAYRVEGFINGG